MIRIAALVCLCASPSAAQSIAITTVDRAYEATALEMAESEVRFDSNGKRAFKFEDVAEIAFAPAASRRAGPTEYCSPCGPANPSSAH